MTSKVSVYLIRQQDPENCVMCEHASFGQYQYFRGFKKIIGFLLLIKKNFVN